MLAWFRYRSDRERPRSLLSEQRGRDTEQGKDSHRNEPGDGMEVPPVSYRS